MEESFRESLFPGAPLTAVLSSAQAKPILNKIRLATMGEYLDVLDINLVQMDNTQEEEGHVSTVDPLLVAPQHVNLFIVQVSLNLLLAAMHLCLSHQMLLHFRPKSRSTDLKKCIDHHSLSEYMRSNKDTHKNSHAGGARGAASHVDPPGVPTEPQPSCSGVSITQTNPLISKLDLNKMVTSILQSLQHS